jgi:16S rRNA (guanine527-N7)-methyltransferase
MIEALAAAAGRPVSRETFDQVGTFVEMLIAESARQNLISVSTHDHIWERHVVDSAQLVALLPRETRSIADVGSGAGLPGVIVALLTGAPTTLIEPRRLRAEFLMRVVEVLGLRNTVVVAAAKVEKVDGQFDVITARAVAALDALLRLTRHLSHESTVWVLPKGRNAKSELVEAQRSWHCHVVRKQSITDPEAEILVISKLGAKSKR